MKKKFLFLFLFLIFISCQNNDEISLFNNDIIKIVKNYSIYSDSINWISIEQELDSLSIKTQSVDRFSTSVDYILGKLRVVGDNHSQHISKNTFRDMGEQNLSTNEPESKYLGNNIAYLKIRSFISINDSFSNNFANDIQSRIKNLDTNNIIGWIVDLRENSGGSLYPMITGLGPLFQDSLLGYFISNKGLKFSWYYSNGASGISYLKFKKNITTINKPYILKNNKCKIAILIGQNTGSSGEMTLISFLGNENVKTFGKPTGGYTTGNSVFVLSDSSYLNLATCFSSDRNMKIYKSAILPDVIIEDYSFFSDKCIDEAIKWIKEK